MLWTTQTDAKLRTGNRGQPQGDSDGCNQLQVQDDFDVSRFLGKWNEVYAYSNTISLDARCVTSTYVFDDDENILIFSQFVDSRRLLIRMIGMAKEKVPGILSVTFPAAC